MLVLFLGSYCRNSCVAYSYSIFLKSSQVNSSFTFVISFIEIPILMLMFKVYIRKYLSDIMFDFTFTVIINMHSPHALHLLCILGHTVGLSLNQCLIEYPV